MAATTDVNVRQDPSSNSAVLAVLSAGDTVTQRGSEENGWLPITYDEKNAWIQAQYVSATTAATSDSAVSTAVVNKNAYVRSSAAADSWIMGSLSQGTNVPVIGDPQGSWTPVNYYGRSGWIASSLLDTDTTDASVKITSAVSQDYLWVRTGESTAYSSIGMLYPGDKASVTGDPFNGWVPISFNGQSAYVAANYARYSTDPSIVTLSASTQDTSSSSASTSTSSEATSSTEATSSASESTGTSTAAESTPAPSATESSAEPSATETTTDPGATETGSASGSSATSVDSSATTPAWTTADVNLRTGPGSDYQSVQVLPEQTQVALTGNTNGDWSEVVHNGARYWISSRFVSTTQGTTDNTPAADPAPAADDSSTVGPTADALPATSGTKYTTADLNAYLTSDQPKPATTVIPYASSVAVTDTVENNRVEIVWNNTAYWVSVDYLSSSQPADNTDTSSTTASTNTSDNTGVASSDSSASAAQSAVDFAMSKVGLPYIWGGTGPNGYDCSGLVQAAYAQAGITLPRTTWDQVNAGTQVSLADAQIGDLVFFYDNSHVGIYIGNGQVVNALNENVGILISDISYLGTPSAVVRVS